MAWAPRLSAGVSASASHMLVRQNVEILTSYLHALPDIQEFEWTHDTRDEILTNVYKTFWGNHMHCFTSEELKTGHLLSHHQAETDPQYGADIPGLPCGHIFRKGDCCYKCKDCALDDSCVLCSRCFNGSEHEGHNVSFYLAVQPGGCCDCGDAEAWKQHYGCVYHPRNIEPRRSDRMIPNELRESMTRTLDCVIDFILDALDESPEETVPPKDEAELGRLVEGRGGPLAVVLWNDEKHSFSEVAAQLMELKGLTPHDAMAVAESIDSEGRAVIWTSHDIARVMYVTKRLSQIDLGVTVRRAQETFYEQIAAVLIEWLVDLMRSFIYGNDGTTLRELVADRLFCARNKDGALAAMNRLPNVNPSKLEWMFYYHTRLWKRPRFRLKDLYITMLSLNHDYKIKMAIRFSSVYNRLMDSYLLVDREAENSVKYFALQLFTVPSIAAHLVKYDGIIDRLHNLIIAFFSDQIKDKVVEPFPKASLSLVNVDSLPFKSKRFMPMFSDLRYICSNPSVQDLIASDDQYISAFLRTCRLFMGVNPNRRMATTHVEYEQEAWISVFNVTLSLSRVVKAYAEAFERASPIMLCNALTIVAQDIVRTCSLSQLGLDDSKYERIVFTQKTFAGVPNDIVKFDVMSGWVSFHHSEHWLLAELLKHVDKLTPEGLQPLGASHLKEIFAQVMTEEDVLVTIEFPTRVLAVVAQIRSGLWVRNGFAIRGQLLHYRDYMLRELCYDQDLYLIQTAFILLDPHAIFLTLLDRFQLLDWFSGNISHPMYEGNQLLMMVEEFLFVLISCLSERASAEKVPLPEIVRREAIHGLALGACSYSELCKRVAERIMDEASFDRALHTIANYRAPEGISDIGQYELKDELYDEVNPFFFHYTRNRREEVEGILKARLTRVTGVKNPVIVPKPLKVTRGPFVDLYKVFESDSLIHIITAGLHNLVLTPPLPESTLPTQSIDAVLDQLMHLAMLGLVETPESFSDKACHVSVAAANNGSLVQVLCNMEFDEKASSIKPKIQWSLDIVEKYNFSDVDVVRKREQAATKPVNDAEEKKRAIKARQAAIMKQFAQQSKSFFESVEDVDDDDEAMDEDDAVPDPTKDLGSCIVCQEKLDSTKSFGALGLVQPSRFRRQMPPGNATYLLESLRLAPSLDDTIPPPPSPEYPKHSEHFNGFISDSTDFGLHTSFCGHFMHVECFNGYTFSVEQRHMNQTQRNHAENIERDEYVCPLCKSLGNVILPVFDGQTYERSRLQTTSQTLSEWTRGMDIELLRTPPDRHLEARLDPAGSGEFTFWSAEDTRYAAGVATDDVHRMVHTVRTAAESVSQQTFHLHGRLPPSDGTVAGGLYLPRDLVAYTIACMEIGQRGLPRTSGGSTLAENLSETSMHTIRSLIASLRKLAALQFPERADGGRSAIRQAIIRRVISQWNQRDQLRLPLFFRDPLTILVEIAAAAPEVLRQVTILMYYLHLARTCLALLKVLADLSPTPVTFTDNNTIPYQRLFGDIRIFVMSIARHSPELERQTAHILRTHGDKFEKLVYTYSLPFLRQAAILTRAIASSPLAHPTNAPFDATEYERLMEILQIPFVSQLPSHESLQSALATWSSNYGVFHSIGAMESSISIEIPGVYRLAQLPRVLDSLFTNPNALVCLRCKTVPTDAAICMFCGTVCCYQSHCCMDEGQRRQGECNMHTRQCAGVIGLYYCVKRCSILYLYAGNGATGPSPYLDVHGEVDMAMRRGRRQYMHPRRLEELRRMWLNHGIPTFIARKLDATMDPGGWDSI